LALKTSRNYLNGVHLDVLSTYDLEQVNLPFFILSKAIIHHVIEEHQLYPNPTIFDFIIF
jgi:hypothetical protein